MSTSAPQAVQRAPKKAAEAQRPVSAANENGELPRGWRWVIMGEVVESMKNGVYRPASAYSDDGIACLRMYNIDGGRIVWRDIKRMRLTDPEIAEYELRPGDLLVNRVNSRELVGKTAVIPIGLERCVFESKNIRVRLRTDLVEPAFVSYRLLAEGSRYFAGNAQQVVGMASISQPQVARFPVPLPNLDEQRRIVAEIEKQFTRLDAGVGALRRVQANLKRYRAAVLKAACDGRLVPTEAELACKEGRTYETAEQLLRRTLAGDGNQWRGAISDLTLPEGWTLAAVEQVGRVKLGRQRSPKHHTGKHMRPYLRVANVFEDRIDLSDVNQMNFSPREFQTFRLEPNDILLNEGQSLELVGRPALYRGELPGVCFQNTLVRFRPGAGVIPKFALATFRAFLHDGRFQRIAKWTTNIAHLGADRFAQLGFPLPPLAEQSRIVAEVERRLSVVEEMEALVNANLQRAARLRQAILQKAFSGSL